MNRRPGQVNVTTEVGYCNFCGRTRNLRREEHVLGTLVRTIVTCESCHRTLSSTMGVAAPEPEVSEEVRIPAPAPAESEPAPKARAKAPAKAPAKGPAKTATKAADKKPAAKKPAATKTGAKKPAPAGKTQARGGSAKEKS